MPWKAAGTDDASRSAPPTRWCARPAGCSTTSPAAISSLAEFVETGNHETLAYLTAFGLRRRSARVADAGRDRLGHRPDDGQLHPAVRPGGRLRPRRRVPRAVPRDRRPVRSARAAADQSMSPMAARSRSPTTAADMTFSYITFQHCHHDDALALSRRGRAGRRARRARRAELPHVDRRATSCCGRPASRARLVARAEVRPGDLASAARVARLGWQANRLSPTEVMAVVGDAAQRRADRAIPEAPQLRDPRHRRPDRSRASTAATGGSSPTVRVSDADADRSSPSRPR